MNQYDRAYTHTPRRMMAEVETFIKDVLIPIYYEYSKVLRYVTAPNVVKFVVVL
jgi:hypothetical protein